MNDHMSASHPPLKVLTCTGTADFLAALPRLVGFTATNCLFVVFFDGSRTRQAMRVDLPATDDPHDCTELLEFLSSAILHYGVAYGAVSAPAIAIMTNETFEACGGPPRARLARRIERRLRRDRVQLRELCVLAPDGWAGFLDPGSPPMGHSLDDIKNSPVTVSACDAEPPIPSLDEMGKIPLVDPARRVQATRAFAALEKITSAQIDALQPATEPRSPSIRMAQSTARIALAPGVTRALTRSGKRLSPREAGKLAHVLAHSDSWWHVAMGVITRPEFPGELTSELGPRSLTRLPVDEPDHLYDHRTALTDQCFSMRSMLAAVCPEITSHEKYTKLRPRLIAAIADLPAIARPGVLAMSAVVWWICGNQTIAYRHVEQALSIENTHEIAHMVRRLVAVPLSFSQVTGAEQPPQPPLHARRP